MTDAIKCPKCGADIPLTETMAHQIEERVRAEVAGQWEERERQHAEAWASHEQELRQQFSETTEQQRSELERLTAEKGAAEIESLRTQLAGQREQQQQFKQTRKLELERLTAEHRLGLRERDLQREQLKQQIAELKNAIDQATPTLQGEVLVQEIECLLRDRFPTDGIRVVKKGARGADIVHTVRSMRGQASGTILWESKRAKNWSNDWIAKLKEDQRREAADVGVIVTTVLPPDCQYMDMRRGVWIVEPSFATALATALRQQLLQLAHLRTLDASDQMGDRVYEYMSSRRFIERFTTGVEAVLELKAGLASERRSHESFWAKREIHIDQVILSSAGIYGDLHGIMGSALETVDALEAEIVRELPARAVAGSRDT